MIRDAWVRKITRRNPFAIQRVPILARIYRYPFDRFPTLGRQVLLGAPNLLAFYLCQRFCPFVPKGSFLFRKDGEDRVISFDPRNTQFSALYFNAFTAGYEPHVSALLDLIMPERGVFLDIGSNWGWFSLLVASKRGFAGTIHAFEPTPASFRDLVSVVKQAGLESSVQCHGVALSNRAGIARMRLPDRFQSGQASMEELGATRVPATGDVLTATLDSMEFRGVSVIKIDTEGAEGKVIHGGASTIQEQKPMIIFESGRRRDDPTGTLEPFRTLEKWGYSFFQLGWLRESEGASYFLGEDADTSPRSDETLSLTPFRVEDRFLLPEALNVFACHANRLNHLEAVFERYHPSAPHTL